MSARPRPASGPSDPDDDVEILEVVGLDEDAPAPVGEEEIEVLFEDEPAAAAAPAASRAPAATAPLDDSERERYLRLYADFENLKKRFERERGEFRQRATESLVARLLPVLDNLERALAARAGEDALRAGVQLIYRHLQEELRREGLRAVEALGTAFDPMLHEAVATCTDSGLPAHTVVGELQRGYFFGNRLLRPALVRVQTEDGQTAAPDAPPRET